MEKPLNFMVEGAFDFVDVRAWQRGKLWLEITANAAKLISLGGERIELTLLHKLVQKVTGKNSKMITFPLPIAMVVAPLAELYYKITKTRPVLTRYALETVFSNSEISSEKARKELGYQPIKLEKSIPDTVRWWWDNLALAKKTLRLTSKKPVQDKL